MAQNSSKSMSDRLMTMKFMQRSAARSVASSPSTPNERSAKRMRLSNGTAAPGTSSTPGISDHEILQSAVTASKKERQQALNRNADSADETHWVLSFKDPLKSRRTGMLKVRQTGYAEVDADHDSEDLEEEIRPTRMKFGGGVKKIEKPVIKSEDESDDDFKSSFEEKRDTRSTQESTGIYVDSEDSPRCTSPIARAPREFDRGPRLCHSCGRAGHLKQHCQKTAGYGKISLGGGR